MQKAPNLPDTRVAHGPVSPVLSPSMRHDGLTLLLLSSSCKAESCSVKVGDLLAPLVLVVTLILVALQHDELLVCLALAIAANIRDWPERPIRRAEISSVDAPVYSCRRS